MSSPRLEAGDRFYCHRDDSSHPLKMAGSDDYWVFDGESGFLYIIYIRLMAIKSNKSRGLLKVAESTLPVQL